MKRGAPTLIACATLLLVAGCGSSSRSSTSPAGGASPPASSTSSGRLKASTTPKFATPPKSAPVQSGTVKIAYRNITIAPDTVKVKLGSTIVWTNYDPVEHNVTSHSGPSSFASKNFVPISDGKHRGVARACARSTRRR